MVEPAIQLRQLLITELHGRQLLATELKKSPVVHIAHEEALAHDWQLGIVQSRQLFVMGST